MLPCMYTSFIKSENNNNNNNNNYYYYNNNNYNNNNNNDDDFINVSSKNLAEGISHC